MNRIFTLSLAVVLSFLLAITLSEPIGVCVHEGDWLETVIKPCQ